MSHYIEFDREVVMTSLVGISEKTIDALTNNDSFQAHIENMDFFAALTNGGDNNVICSISNTVRRKWCVLSFAGGRINLLSDIAANSVKQCAAGHIRLRGKQVKPSAYLAKYEQALADAKYVKPAVLANALGGLLIGAKAIKHLEDFPYGRQCLEWLEQLPCFTPDGHNQFTIGAPKIDLHVVAILAVVYPLLNNRHDFMDFSGEQVFAAYLNNALSCERPKHLYSAG